MRQPLELRMGSVRRLRSIAIGIIDGNFPIRMKDTRLVAIVWRNESFQCDQEIKPSLVLP
jgi:hypothetical protein